MMITSHSFAKFPVITKNFRTFSVRALALQQDGLNPGWELFILDIASPPDEQVDFHLESSFLGSRYWLIAVSKLDLALQQTADLFRVYPTFTKQLQIWLYQPCDPKKVSAEFEEEYMD